MPTFALYNDILFQSQFLAKIKLGTDIFLLEIKYNIAIYLTKNIYLKKYFFQYYLPSVLINVVQ